jgi:predicted ATPase
MGSFISKIKIDKVRHLQGITIPLSTKQRKNLIFTGKNGSGKTSVLEALSRLLSLYDKDNYSNYNNWLNTKKYYEKDLAILRSVPDQDKNIPQILQREQQLKNAIQETSKFEPGLSVEFTNPMELLKQCSEGNFIIAYYEAERQYKFGSAKTVEKVELKERYNQQDNPGQRLMSYLLDMKTTEAMAKSAGEDAEAKKIATWFVNFEQMLRNIFDDSTLKLSFDINSFAFSILQAGKEPFSFDSLSSGYAAIIDIVADLIMRMQKHVAGFAYNLEGVVLIDEIETHLHLEMQKAILPFLTAMFPKIQFIVSTHSPFVLSSLSNVVIYDLANQIMVDSPVGLSNLPYEGVVEGYFRADTLSNNLKQKFERYKELVTNAEPTDDVINEVSVLDTYLEEIPDYLAMDIMPEYRKLRLAWEEKVLAHD